MGYLIKKPNKLLKSTKPPGTSLLRGEQYQPGLRLGIQNPGTQYISQPPQSGNLKLVRKAHT